MIHWPTAVFQRFSNKLQPVFQSQVRPFVRPEDIPTDGADTFEAVDVDEETRRRREEQIRLATARPGNLHATPSLSPGTNPTTAATPLTPATPITRVGGNVLASPETRALMSNVFKNSLTPAMDAARDEAPRVFSDLGGKEYDKEKDKRHATRMAGNPYRAS